MDSEMCCIFHMKSFLQSQAACNLRYQYCCEFALSGVNPFVLSVRNRHCWEIIQVKSKNEQKGTIKTMERTTAARRPYCCLYVSKGCNYQRGLTFISGWFLAVIFLFSQSRQQTLLGNCIMGKEWVGKQIWKSALRV